MDTENPKKTPLYFCKQCQIKTNHKQDYKKHLLTAKHKRLTNSSNQLTKNPQIDDKNNIFTCKNCNKIYTSRVGLWKHNKKCNDNLEKEHDSNYDQPYSDNDHDEMKTQKELIKYLMKENAEFKQMMIEQNKHMLEMAKNSAGHHNTNTNNSNNSFNLNFFLNETCKNAMNIMDL